MYDELVKRLRNRRICIQQSGSLDDFPLLAEAADAIEELQADKAALNGTVTNLLEQIQELGKPRWIPVTETERLPKPFDRVIVYDMRWGVLSAMKGENDSWGGRNDIVIEKVTHWQPLPDPPKEET